MTSATNAPIDMLGALRAEGANPEHADELALFGQFVGAWDLDIQFFPRSGEGWQVSGLWLFDWILDGQGIQDVLIHNTPGGRVSRGTTIRLYDPVEACWRIGWFDPISRTYVMLVGDRSADGILVEGTERGDQLRWTFNEFTRTSFHWLGHISEDGGATWRLEQEMRARRRRDE